MRKVLFTIILIIAVSVSFAQKPGFDNLQYWMDKDVDNVTASLTLNGTTRDTVIFDLRDKGFMSQNSAVKYTGSFNFWFSADSLDGNTSITIRYGILSNSLASGTLSIYDLNYIYNYRKAIENFNFADEQLYGPFKCYCEDGFGIMFTGANTSTGDTATVNLYIDIGNELNTNTTPYRDAIRYLNDYTNDALLLVGSTDTLTVDVFLGNTEGYSGIQFTPLAYTAVESLNVKITPYTWWGQLATNRAYTAFTNRDVSAGTSVDTSLTLIPCKSVRVEAWITDCTDDSLTFTNNRIGIRFKMSGGQ